jgi:hypothetical protein
MNTEIKAVLDALRLDGQPVPNGLMYYNGEAETFLKYSPTSDRVGLAGDDMPLEMIEAWDIDVYSKTNYLALATAVKKAMLAAGWAYKGSGSDTYDEETKMFHRLLEFEIESSEDLSVDAEGEA